jgi:hypothetical protein
MLGLSRKLVTMTRKFIPENYIFKRKDAEINFEHGKHGINGKINAR